MTRNIVLCSDGTGNSARKYHGTNVKRLYDALQQVVPAKAPARRSGAKPAARGERLEQVSFYDDGVGTEKSKLLRVLGGALGLGLSRNIREIYSFASMNYRRGDKIFLFGFSRGAHTVRAVAGLIAKFGLVSPQQLDGKGASSGETLAAQELDRRIRLAYRLYRCQNGLAFCQKLMVRLRLRKSPKTIESILRNGNAFLADGPDEGVDVEFVGVWDTVDAVGAPIPEFADVIDALIYRFRFRDFDLNPKVHKGCQALAVDDARATFHPVLWNEPEGSDGGASGSPRIEQVWFPGVHANVGGGYPHDELAHVPLLWMMEKAEKSGLRFRADDKVDFAHASDPHGTMYDSRAGLAAFYRYKPRFLDALMVTADEGQPLAYRRSDPGPIYGVTRKPAVLRRLVIHESVLERAQKREVYYAPPSFPPDQSYSIDGCPPGAVGERQPHPLGDIMNSARDLMWWRRINYHLAVGLITAFVAIGFRPRWFGIDPERSDWPWFARRVADLDQLVPAILDTLVGTYSCRSSILLVFLALTGILGAFSWHVGRTLDAEADLAWRQSFDQVRERRAVDDTWVHESARWLRTGAFANAWMWFARRLWPWIATGVIAGLLIWGLVTLISA